MVVIRNKGCICPSVHGPFTALPMALYGCTHGSLRLHSWLSTALLITLYGSTHHNSVLPHPWLSTALPITLCGSTHNSPRLYYAQSQLSTALLITIYGFAHNSPRLYYAYMFTIITLYGPAHGELSTALLVTLYGSIAITLYGSPMETLCGFNDFNLQKHS